MTDTGLPAHSQAPLPDVEKIGLDHKEVYHDHELEPGKVSKDEAYNTAQLTPEELELEKKLKKRIDWQIMPLVCIVYLM